MQIPKYENCDRQVLSGDDVKSCVLVKCAGSSGVALQYCDAVTCGRRKQVGYHNGDKNAEYPDCCSYPICEY
ncbi:hypothetical protein KM043_010977 [Ampulex compressa]|nr:hypothetical protein KM043_010977 [Ampulex compressa]